MKQLSLEWTFMVLIYSGSLFGSKEPAFEKVRLTYIILIYDLCHIILASTSKRFYADLHIYIDSLGPYITFHVLMVNKPRCSPQKEISKTSPGINWDDWVKKHLVHVHLILFFLVKFTYAQGLFFFLLFVFTYMTLHLLLNILFPNQISHLICKNINNCNM